MLKNNADDWDFVVRGNSWRLILLNHPHSKMCQTQFLRIRSSIEIQDIHSQQKSHFQKIYRPHQNLICSCNHIRRFQEYFNHIHIFIGSTTLQFFAILLPKWCKYPILGSKTNRGDIRLYFKTYEKNC